MSNPFETVERTVNAIALGTAAVAANYLENWLSGKIPSTAIRFLAAAALVVVLTQFLIFISERILNNSRPLRAFLFRGYDVEGNWWIDLAIENGTIASIGITSFKIRNYGLSWHGENHDLNGHVTGTFVTRTSIIAWPKVSFWFNNDPSNHSSTTSEGLCEILFDQPNGGPLVHYSGWGAEVGSKGTSKVVGWKVTDKDLAARLASRSTRASTLLEIARDIPEFALAQVARNEEGNGACEIGRNPPATDHSSD